MASPPKFTENADAPLSAEELAGDRAASGQSTDPLDKPDDAGTDWPESEDMAGEDVVDELQGREQQVVETAATRLPPG